MTIARVKAAGWAMFEVLTSAQMTEVDINTSEAVHGAGGAYDPIEPIALGGEGIKVTGKHFIDPITDPRAVLDWAPPVDVNNSRIPFATALADGDQYFAANMQAGSRHLLLESEGGIFWSTAHTAGDATLEVNCCATNGLRYGNGLGLPGRVVAGGLRPGGATTPLIHGNGTDFETLSPPGSPVNISAIAYEPFTDRFILAGRTASAPWLCWMDTDGVAFTLAAVPGDITGANDALSIAVIPDPSTSPVTRSVVVATWENQTKVAYSTDGGSIWTSQVAAFTSGDHVAIATHFPNDPTVTGIFPASPQRIFVFDGASSATGARWSINGATWTSTGITRPGVDSFDGAGRFGYLGGALIIKHTGGYYYSTDGAQNWKFVGFDFSPNGFQSFAFTRKRLHVYRGTAPAQVHLSRRLGLP